MRTTAKHRRRLAGVFPSNALAWVAALALLTPALAAGPAARGGARPWHHQTGDPEALARIVQARGIPFEPAGEPVLRHAIATLEGSAGERRLRAVIDLSTASLLEVAELGPGGLRRSTIYRHRVTAVGHRGSVALAPENTLASIGAAIEVGVDLLELDLRATRDGVPVLLHDSTLDRTTDGSGPIAERTLKEVAHLDAGSWFGDGFAGERIPTLRSALERIGGRARIDVDFKAGDPEPVVELLREHGHLERATFHSNSPAVLDRVRALAPALPIRPTLRGGIRALETLIGRYDPPIVNLDWRHASPELIREVHLAGRLAFVNTLGPGDGRERIRAAIAAGADFVQSDRLERLVPLVRAASTTRHAGWGGLDAHNAYPYHGRFADRVARARGRALAIEQDLCWWVDERGHGHSLVSHGEPFDGTEPRLEDFFAGIRDRVEQELAAGDPRRWPVLTLNLDFKRQGDHAEHHAAVLRLLRRFESWLTVAERTASIEEVAPLLPGPVLVLTGSSERQRASFHDALRPGERLLLFGAAASAGADPDGLPLPPAADNYRRWWNHSWRAVEPEGQPEAGAFTAEEEARLVTLVDRAHRAGLWIRFYTLNGAGAERSRANGWSPSYDFGSYAAVAKRWRAAQTAGVDFIATDQYEELGSLSATAAETTEAAGAER